MSLSDWKIKGINENRHKNKRNKYIHITPPPFLTKRAYAIPKTNQAQKTKDSVAKIFQAQKEIKSFGAKGSLATKIMYGHG